MRVDPARFAPGMERQLERFRQALDGGMPRRGWKIGINVPEVIRGLRLPHSGVGWLDGRRVFDSGAVIDAPAEARLHVEPEVAVRLSGGVAAGSDADTARACIDAVHPALEVLDYGRAGSGLDAVVAHCMFHDAAVLGPPGSLEAARKLGREWPRLRVGSRASDPPRDDLVPSDLGELVAFVASFLAAFDQELAAGDLVLTGSYTPTAAPIAPGEEAVAEFGPLGTVSARIAG